MNVKSSLSVRQVNHVDRVCPLLKGRNGVGLPMWVWFLPLVLVPDSVVDFMC